MAYDEQLAERVRGILAKTAGVREQKMFGGLSFLVNDHMCCGLNDDDLVVRVGPEAYEQLLDEPHARKMDFTHRPLRGFVYVAPMGTKTDEALAAWIEHGLAYVRTLPPKKRRKKRNAKKGRHGKPAPGRSSSSSSEVMTADSPAAQTPRNSGR